MSDLKKLTQLREDIDHMRRESDKAQGALDAILTRLKNEFDCDDLEDAENLLEALRTKLESTRALFRSEMAKFERKWGEKLK